MIARGSTIRTALLEKARAAALPPRQTYEVLAPIQSRSEIIHRFNPSLIRFAGRWLMAYRVGRVQSRIALGELDHEFRPLCETLIALPSHAEARDGQEDPRLFLFRGQLWLSYTGLARPRNTIMLARITPEGAVLENLVPDFPARQMREKNWVFFESGGELHAVYHGAPHRVLRIVGGKAELLPGESRQFVPPTAFPWAFGDVRGGAPPVLAGGEWHHFFHTQLPQKPDRPLYCLGLYTFADAPPFGIARLARMPLYAPTGARPDEQTPYVVFPGGAVLDGDRWLIAVGEWDAYCRILEYSRTDIESRLEVA